MSKARYRHAISHAAEADLDDIWLYTSQQWSVEQADTYYKQLIGTIEALAERRLVWQKADHTPLLLLRNRPHLSGKELSARFH